MKYFYTLRQDGTISALYVQETAHEGMVEITKADYDSYLSIIRNVEQRDGYDAHVFINPDFTFVVEYTEAEPLPEELIEELIDDNPEDPLDPMELINELIGEGD